MLDLQAQDSRLAQLAHRRQSLPELAELVEQGQRAAELDGRRIEAQTTVDDLTREQKKADAEVELVKTRRARDEERLNSGAITNPKDLESLQHELVALERRIGTLEDAELEVMEALEDAERELAAVTHDLDEVRAAIDRLEAARDAAWEAIDAEVATVTADRDALAEQVPADLMGLYDKVRGQHSGLGAAPLRARRCEGCQLEINGADLREIAGQAEDEVLRCPECSRILVRTAESGL